MRLNSFSVRGYRSLYDVAFQPADFTAIVGPNNSGKTNFVDALQFLGEIARSGLEVAVGREGGFENLAFRRQRRLRGPVCMSFDASLELDQFRYRRARRAVHTPTPEKVLIDISYSFSLRAESGSQDSDYRVESEELLIASAGAQLLSFSREEGEFHFETPAPTDTLLFQEAVEPFDDELFREWVEERTGPSDLAFTQMEVNTVIGDLAAALGSTRLFQLTPVECRKPGASTPNPELERHGANLPAVVRYVKQHHSDAWDAVMVAMRRIMPGLTAIDTVFTADRHLSLIFAEEGTRGWTANEVSDGTIQSLALFACLFDPRTPLVLIEEPENAVHPWIVRSFVTACREAHDKQIVLTTHSPALIAYLKPNELDVMWRTSDGHSHINALLSVDPDADRLWSEGTVDLFQVIDGGWIRQAVPPGLA